MDNNFLYLTYYQVMSFMYRLDEMQKENPDFNDGFAKSFSEYVINRACEIAMTYPQIKFKIVPGSNKYKVAKSMVEYLTNLTGINVFDKETLNRYIPLIKDVERRASSLAFGDGESHANRKR